MSLIGTLGSGVSALRTFMKGLEVIGNNIANVNTTGFKSSEAKYSDSFSNILERSSPSTATSSNTQGVAVGTGVRLAGVNSNFTQGALQTTGQSTDLGISGNGFFIVRNPTDGALYATRAGDFRIDSSGYLVTARGFRVQGDQGGSIADVQVGLSIPAGTDLQSFSIDSLGNVVEFYSDGTSATNNQILLQKFNDPGALTKQGDNLYAGFGAAGPATATLSAATNGPGTNGFGTIQSGTIELSNVDLTDQFANLITTQRSFQAGSRLITVSDSVLEDIVNLKQR
jgi:flagellar hook protein FlgE